MNDVGARASDGGKHAVGSGGVAAGATLGAAGSIAAGLLAAGGRLGLAAVASAVGGAAVFAATRAGRRYGWPSRWIEFTVTALGRIPEAAVMSGIAWHFRGGRTAAAAVSAIALTFLAAYARTRARSLGWPSRVPSAEPLRYGLAVAALAVPGFAEAAGWALGALTFVEFCRVSAEAWRHAGGA